VSKSSAADLAEQRKTTAKFLGNFKRFSTLLLIKQLHNDFFQAVVKQ
jgi:hypothetical protein